MLALSHEREGERERERCGSRAPLLPQFRAYDSIRGLLTLG